MKAGCFLCVALATIVAFGPAQAGKPKAPPPDEAYTPMALSDLKVDIKQLNGKLVVVEADLQSFGELALLKSGPMDMTPIFAETDKLPRADRKKLVDGCQMLLCPGVFYVKVKPSPLGPGVEVQKVTWD